MDRITVYEEELAKLTEIFQDVDEPKRRLVEGLVQDAAFLMAENYILRQVISKTGMVKIHPEHPDLQKSTEAAKQYMKNVNSYAVVIKTLNGILSKNLLEPDDEFDEFLKKMRGET
ncbi:MAG: hypothetical protein AB7E31_04275 [Desulfitobacterium sp.]